MKIISPETLDSFRTGPCAWCGRKGYTDPHHLFCRGLGGGLRLDVRINLIAMCRSCHGLFHAGRIERSDLLALVAAREGLLQDEIEREIYRLRRLDKP